MRRFLFLSALILLSVMGYSQEEWISLKNGKNNTIFQPVLISSDASSSIVEFSLDGFYFHEVSTHKGQEKIVDVTKASRILSAEDPDLVKLTASLLIPDMDNMIVTVIETEYTEYNNVNIAPSKGNLSRSIEPADLPYIYGEAYSKDEFYPGKLADLGDPYIIRDYRGLAVHTYPFQYNPVSKVLRVYSKIVVEVSIGSGEALNPFVRTKTSTNIDKEFKNIYASHFLNYNTAKNALLTPELGAILIISHGSYIDAMAPYVEWKNQMGHPTEIFDVATIGTTAAQVKTFVQNYYNSTNLTYLLLVGDGSGSTIVPTFNVSTSQGAGFSDNMYGYLVGNDKYQEIFVGRFSAENVGHVNTQVQRTLEYEKAINMSNGWLNVGMGIARLEGAGNGHNGGESDCVHMDLIRGKLLSYNYATVHQDYDKQYQTQPNPCGVAVTSAAQISNRINTGAGVINYCNHGNISSWSVGSYAASHVNALANVGKLPFVWSVACLNGRFVNETCFGEVWLRATHNGQPTGALATNMSTVNQSWHPPMDAQDEFNDVLIGTYANLVRRSFGGLCVQGYYKMNDLNGNAGYEMTDTWTVFGDPSIKVRTDNPLPLAITHVSEVLIGTDQIIVECAVQDAFVSLTINNSIIGTGFVNGGTAVIDIEPLTNPGDQILVVATGYNRIPAFGNIDVIEIVEQPIANFIGTPLEILEGEAVSFTCQSEFANQRFWEFGDENTSDEINPIHVYLNEGVYTVKLTVTNSLGSDLNEKINYITVLPNTNPPVADFIADATSIVMGNSVNFTDLSQNIIDTWEWEFEGGVPSSSNNQHPSGVLYAEPGIYTVKLTVTNDFGSDVEEKISYIEVLIPSYCEASALQEEEYISNVTFETINNNSGWSGYSDFTHLEAQVVQGGSYPISITNAEYYSLDEVFVWIDYNRDGVFDTDTELAYHGTYTGTTTEVPHTWNGTVNIPAVTSIGSTRMRVRLNYGGSVGGSIPNSTPCGTATYGEVEDYSVFLLSAEMPPIAGFVALSPEICDGTVQFTDQSIFADTWYWDFGDGNHSTEQHPEHTYTISGTYSVSLFVTNEYGDDTHLEIDYIEINVPNIPQTTGAISCGGSELTLSAVGNGVLYWYDSPEDGNLIHTGTEYTDIFNLSTTFWVESAILYPVTAMAGRPNNTGDGGNWGNNDHQHGLIFDAYQDFTLVSVKVYANGAANRTITLRDNGGNVLATRTVNIPAGESRVTLNIDVQEGSNLVLRGEGNPQLFRNNNNSTTYPLTLPGVLSITESTASAPAYNAFGNYYFFYDWEVEFNETCNSERSPVTAEITGNPSVYLGDDITQCGGTVVLDAGVGFAVYTWNGVEGIQTYEVSSSQTITLEVEDSNGCTATDEIEVTINANPEISLGDDITQCGGTVVLDGGAGFVIYTWNGVEGIQTYEVSASQTVTLEVEDDNGCIATEEIEVTIHPNPSVSLGDDITQCGGTVVLDAGVGFAVYTWNGVEGIQTYEVSSTQTITLEVEDSNGCNTTDEIEVTIYPELEIYVTTTSESVFGAEDGTATVVINGGTLPYQIQWDTGSNLEQISGLAAGEYFVTVTDFNDCNAIASGTVYEGNIPEPVALFEADITTGCDVLTVQFSDLSVNDPTSWTWDFGDGNGSNEQHPEHTYIVPGVYTVSLIVSNAGGTDEIEIIDYILVGETPQIALSMTEESEPGAEDGTATVTVTSSYSYTVLWSNMGETETISNLVAGEYCVTVINTEHSCQVSDCIEVAQGDLIPEPVALFEADVTTGCNVLTVQFTDLSTNDPISWTWDFGDGNGSNEQHPEHTYTVPGVYTVSLTVTNAGGTDVMEITDYIILGETPTFAVITTAASGQNVADGSAYVEIYGGTAPYTIIWSNNAQGYEIEGLLPGYYSVMVSDANNCLTTQAFEIIWSTYSDELSVSPVFVYPNPAKDIVIIETASQIADMLVITDILGKVIITLKPDAEKTEMDISTLSEGVYFIRVLISDTYKVEKLIVR